MSRLTGLVKPRKRRRVKINDSFWITYDAVDQQCPVCKRYFRDVKKHQRMATACKELRKEVK